MALVYQMLGFLVASECSQNNMLILAFELRCLFVMVKLDLLCTCVCINTSVFACLYFE